MNRSYNVLFTLSIALLTVCASTLRGQSSMPPDCRFGIFVDNGGPGIAFALSTHLQINTAVNLSTGDSEGQLFLAPSIKYLFHGVVDPYLIGGAQITAAEHQEGPDVFVRIGAGIDYYITTHVGVYGHVTLFRSYTSSDPTTTDFGIAVDGDGRVGVEWYL